MVGRRCAIQESPRNALWSLFWVCVAYAALGRVLSPALSSQAIFERDLDPPEPEEQLRLLTPLAGPDGRSPIACLPERSPPPMDGPPVVEESKRPSAARTVQLRWEAATRADSHLRELCCKVARYEVGREVCDAATVVAAADATEAADVWDDDAEEWRAPPPPPPPAWERTIVGSVDVSGGGGRVRQLSVEAPLLPSQFSCFVVRAVGRGGSFRMEDATVNERLKKTPRDGARACSTPMAVGRLGIALTARLRIMRSAQA